MIDASVEPAPRTSEANIWRRIIRTDGDEVLSPEAAQAILRLRFGEADLNRMHELTVRNQDDRLAPLEVDELAAYRRAAALLDLFHSWARLAAQ